MFKKKKMELFVGKSKNRKEILEKLESNKNKCIIRQKMTKHKLKKIYTIIRGKT